MPTTRIKPGLVLNGWQFIERLGGGAQAPVWSALEMNLNRPIAIKIIEIKKGETTEHQKTIKELKEEARIWARLEQHVNVVTLHGYKRVPHTYEDGEEFIYHCLAMEQAHETLRARLKRDWPFEDRELFDFMVQIAKGIRYAHEEGVVHRDLKPDNILLSTQSGGDIRVAVSDFGIARALGMFYAGERWQGTSPYAAPEQKANRFTRASDIHALGVVYLEMLVGKKPKRCLRKSGGLKRDILFQILPWIQEGTRNRRLVMLLQDMVHPKSSERPKIEEVVAKLEHIQHVETEYTAASTVAEGTDKVQEVANRYVWHPLIHELFDEKLRFYWVRGFLSVKNLKQAVCSMLDPVLKQRYCVYEVYGDYDLIVRAWATDELMQDVHERLLNIKNLSGGDLAVLHADKPQYVWSGAIKPLSSKAMQKQLEETFQKLSAPEIGTALRKKGLAVGDIHELDDTVIKAFTAIRCFLVPRSELYGEVLRCISGNSQPVERVSVYGAQSGDWDVLVKYHVSSYYQLQSIPYRIQQKLSKYRVRSNTCLVTSYPMHESDDGPFLDRLLNL